MLSQVGGGAPRTSENEAMIESEFRRLLASIEGEREKIRQLWQSIDGDTKSTSAEMERLRQDTEEWCHAERHKVISEWNRLDKLKDKMCVRYPNERGVILDINCSGRLFAVPKSALCSVEESHLNHMFSDAFVHSVPKDSKGRYFLDFNPTCFGIIVEYLQNAQHVTDTPPPIVPPEEQQNMDILAEALNLKIFLKPNGIQKNHSTSLRVNGSQIESTMQGWQIIAAKDPLPMSSASYFEIRIANNPDASRGGLALGLCGHQPSDKEIFKLAMPDAVWYVSHNGLVAGKIGDKDVIAMENMQKKVQFKTGSVVGIKHDIANRSIQFYLNRISIGTCTLNTHLLESFRVLYPVFGLYIAGQMIQVDFAAVSPSASKGVAVSGERTAAE